MKLQLALCSAGVSENEAALKHKCVLLVDPCIRTPIRKADDKYEILLGNT